MNTPGAAGHNCDTITLTKRVKMWLCETGWSWGPEEDLEKHNIWKTTNFWKIFIEEWVLTAFRFWFKYLTFFGPSCYKLISPSCFFLCNIYLGLLLWRSGLRSQSCLATWTCLQHWEHFSTSVFALIFTTQRYDIIKFSYICKHNVLQGGEFVSDWLQRAVCKYGDQTGLI